MNKLNDHPTLFNMDEYNNVKVIKSISHYMKSPIFVFSIDNVKKLSRIHGVLCQTIIWIYDVVIKNEKFSNNSNNQIN
jgi:hypothetical protein